ncbi:MAG: helix-turn-helix domain-containing protein [Candidatus Omnitrophica bacterium]|nr:helix-turn-helix domain-containing protein [Candidatus Omnitrophota bacterium]
MSDQDQPIHPEKVMTAEEVSRYLKLPLSTVWSLTRRGKIPAVKVGKHWRYLEKDVRRFLLGQQTLTKSPQNEIQEKRECPRLNCSIPAVMRINLPEKEGEPHDVTIRNLSEDGFFLSRETQSGGVEPGDPVILHFFDLDLSDQFIEVEGRVIHRNGGKGIGVKFRHLGDSMKEVIRDYVG